MPARTVINHNRNGARSSAAPAPNGPDMGFGDNNQITPISANTIGAFNCYDSEGKILIIQENNSKGTITPTNTAESELSQFTTFRLMPNAKLTIGNIAFEDGVQHKLDIILTNTKSLSVNVTLQDLKNAAAIIEAIRPAIEQIKQGTSSLKEVAVLRNAHDKWQGPLEQLLSFDVLLVNKGCENYFRSCGVFKELTGSDFAKLPTEVIGLIEDHLSFSDIIPE